MERITDAILERAVRTIPESIFDSHRVIEVVMTIATRQYADDLGATPGMDPILQLHAEIGSRLLTLGCVEPTRKVKSRNVRGQTTENQEWRRR